MTVAAEGIAPDATAPEGAAPAGSADRLAALRQRLGAAAGVLGLDTGTDADPTVAVSQLYGRLVEHVHAQRATDSLWLLMTALAGTVLGSGIQFVMQMYEHYPFTNTVLIAVLVCAVAIWILGGVSNAVIVAERLGVDSQLGRLGLIGTYLFLPVLLMATPVILIKIAYASINSTQAWLGCILVLIPIVRFIQFAWRLRTAAKNAAYWVQTGR